MKEQDIRWEQRFSNYNKALVKLENAVDLARQRDLSDLEKQGLIHTFEYAHELAWNVMKDYLEYQGINNITGSRDAIRESFANGLIQNGEQWMATIKSRNQTSHTYNEATANEIEQEILTIYFDLFKSFQVKMETIRSGQQGEIFDTMKYGLNQGIIDAILACLAASSRIEAAILYGSRAKGNFKNASDIDLTLKGPALTMSDVFQLENQLDDLLLPYKFDISIYHQIQNPDLLDHIERVGALFYKKQPITV